MRLLHILALACTVTEYLVLTLWKAARWSRKPEPKCALAVLLMQPTDAREVSGLGKIDHPLADC